MSKTKCIICHNSTSLHTSNLFDDRYGAEGHHDIYRCNSCGFGRTHPGLGKSAIGKFYAKHYPLSKISAPALLKRAKVEKAFTAWFTGRNNTTHWYANKGESVLDVGSGSGISLIEISMLEAIPYGVEPDPNAQKLAKTLKLNVHEGFITDNPFKGKKFDLITASQVIEHEPDPLNFLIALRKKLKKNGRGILSFPNGEALNRYIFGKRWLHWHVPYHLNFFSKKSFSLLAKNAGLKVTSIKTVTPNEWTLLQLRMLTTSPTEGEVSTIWKNSGTGNSSQDTTSLKTKLQYLLGLLLKYTIAPLNRIIDALSLGESLVVEVQISNE